MRQYTIDFEILIKTYKSTNDLNVYVNYHLLEDAVTLFNMLSYDIIIPWSHKMFKSVLDLYLLD